MSDIDIIENIGNDFRYYTDTSCSRCGEKSVCAPLAIGGGGKIRRYYICGECRAYLDLFFAERRDKNGCR